VIVTSPHPDAKSSGTFDNPQLELRAQYRNSNIRIRGSTASLSVAIANRVATVALDSQPEALNIRARPRNSFVGRL
jgi:hypothetical protein